MFAAAPVDPTTFQVTLTNNTGLDPTQYDVYAIGLATTGSTAGCGTYLGSDGDWYPSPLAANGTVLGVKFTTTPLTINLQSETKVIGGRFYTVVVPKGDVPYIPTQLNGTSYTPPSSPVITGGGSSFYWSKWNGSGFTPIPGSRSWLYSAGEFTKDPKTGSDGKLTIDLSNVDFWSFPGYQSSVAGASLTPPVAEVAQPGAVLAAGRVRCLDEVRPRRKSGRKRRCHGCRRVRGTAAYESHDRRFPSDAHECL